MNEIKKEDKYVRYTLKNISAIPWAVTFLSLLFYCVLLFISWYKPDVFVIILKTRTIEFINYLSQLEGVFHEGIFWVVFVTLFILLYKSVSFNPSYQRLRDVPILQGYIDLLNVLIWPIPIFFLIYLAWFLGISSFWVILASVIIAGIFSIIPRPSTLLRARFKHHSIINRIYRIFSSNLGLFLVSIFGTFLGLLVNNAYLSSAFLLTTLLYLLRESSTTAQLDYDLLKYQFFSRGQGYKKAKQKIIKIKNTNSLPSSMNTLVWVGANLYAGLSKQKKPIRTAILYYLMIIAYIWVVRDYPALGIISLAALAPAVLMLINTSLATPLGYGDVEIINKRKIRNVIILGETKDTVTIKTRRNNIVVLPKNAIIIHYKST